MEEDIRICKALIDGANEQFKEYKYHSAPVQMDTDDVQAIENLINKNKELEADLYASNSIINEYIENNKEQEKMIELYEEKLMFALSPTTHELAQDTKQNFKKIIRENINEDTYTIKKVLKAYWNKKAKGE